MKGFIEITELDLDPQYPMPPRPATIAVKDIVGLRPQRLEGGKVVTRLTLNRARTEEIVADECYPDVLKRMAAVIE